MYSPLNSKSSENKPFLIVSPFHYFGRLIGILITLHNWVGFYLPKYPKKNNQGVFYCSLGERTINRNEALDLLPPLPHGSCICHGDKPQPNRVEGFGTCCSLVFCTLKRYVFCLRLPSWCGFSIAHRIHGTGIFTFIYHKKINQM